MALKKPEEKATATAAEKPTEAQLEAQRAEEAKALEDKKLEEQKLEEQQLAEQKLEDEKLAQESADKETQRLADLQLETDKQVESDRERLEQEAEVALAAGKTPLERKLVLVESRSFSDLKQPSTGTWIYGKGQAHLLNDGWLENQINAKLMFLVKE